MPYALITSSLSLMCSNWRHASGVGGSLQKKRSRRVLRSWIPGEAFRHWTQTFLTIFSLRTGRGRWREDYSSKCTMSSVPWLNATFNTSLRATTLISPGMLPTTALMFSLLSDLRANRPNTHQPKKSPPTSVGARAVERGWEGL